jgi:hypothetical protein
MKVSKKSWHYKIRNLGNDWPVCGDTLCRYFWAFVFKAFGISFGSAIFAVLVYGYFTSPNWISNSILVLFILASIVLPILAICFIRKRFGHPLELPKETLIIEYLKAKKNRVCPLIEYVD